jgi:hypothetical protein
MKNMVLGDQILEDCDLKYKLLTNNITFQYKQGRYNDLTMLTEQHLTV